MRFVANKWGLGAESDFAVLQLGGQPEMMAGLVGEAVQAAMLNAEFAILAKREKYTQLVDVASLGLPFLPEPSTLAVLTSAKMKM